MFLKILRFIVLMFMFGACLPQKSFAMAERQPKVSEMIGQKAPEFVLDTIYNGTKKLSQARGDKKAILFFWATWCPHCHTQLLRLNNSIETLKRRGYVVILVDVGEAANDVKAYLKFNTIFLDSFLDPDSSTQDIYRVEGVPTIYYLDEQGIIRGMQHELPGNVDELFSKKP